MNETVTQALRGTGLEKNAAAYVSTLYLVQALRAARKSGELGAYGTSSPTEVVQKTREQHPQAFPLPSAIIRKLIAQA